MGYQDQESTAAFICSCPSTEQAGLRNYATDNNFMSNSHAITSNQWDWVKYGGRRIPLTVG